MNFRKPTNIQANMDFIITICLGPSLTYGLIIYSHFIGSIQNFEACNFEGPWHFKVKTYGQNINFFPLQFKDLGKSIFGKGPFTFLILFLIFLKVFFHESYLEWSLLGWYQFKPKLSSRKSQISNCVGKTRAIKST
jgi:hypothetical protein